MAFPTTSSSSTRSLPDTAKSWHTSDIEEALNLLESNPDQGLTPKEVTQRQQQYGFN
ncbi:MAG TPA: hypothetical protein DEG47_18300, partial [Cyanobacteria bacterium UBA11148]|nr:hypothetical protein [Cyanobacteria bacterium UBA11148]